MILKKTYRGYAADDGQMFIDSLVGQSISSAQAGSSTQWDVSKDAPATHADVPTTAADSGSSWSWDPIVKGVTSLFTNISATVGQPAPNLTRPPPPQQYMPGMKTGPSPVGIALVALAGLGAVVLVVQLATSKKRA